MKFRFIIPLLLGCASLAAEDGQFVDVGFDGPPPCPIFMLRELDHAEWPQVIAAVELAALDVSGRLINLEQLNADEEVLKAGPLTEARIPGSLRISISGNTAGLFTAMSESREAVQLRAEALVRKYCKPQTPFVLKINPAEISTITKEDIDKKTLQTTNKVVTAYTVPFTLSIDGLPVFNGDHNVRIASNGLSHLSYIPLSIHSDANALTKQAPLSPSQSLRKFSEAPVTDPQLAKPFWVVIAHLGYLMSGDGWKSDRPRVQSAWQLRCQTTPGADGKQFTLWLAATDGAFLSVEFPR